jgi:hypothetical protein
MVTGKMIYVDSTLASFVFYFVVFDLIFVFQTTLIKSVQMCMKLKMRPLTPMLASKVAPMVASIYGNLLEF